MFKLLIKLCFISFAEMYSEFLLYLKSTDFSWQKTGTFIAHKQPTPAAWEQDLLHSIWTHPTAATAFSHSWLWRQWETLKEAEFAKLCDDTWKSKIVENRQIPARCLWLTASWDCPTVTYTRLLYHCTEQELDSLWQSGCGVLFLSSDRFSYDALSRLILTEQRGRQS